MSFVGTSRVGGVGESFPAAVPSGWKGTKFDLWQVSRQSFLGRV